LFARIFHATPAPVRRAIARILPDTLSDAVRDRVIRAATPAQPVIEQSPYRLALLRALHVVDPWCVAWARVNADGIDILGWALPLDGDYSAAGFTVNDIPFEEVEYPTRLDHVAPVFAFRSDALMSGFTCIARLPLDRVFRNDVAVFKYVRRGSLDAIWEGHNYYFHNPSVETVPLPEPALRARVHGGDAEASFRLEGFSTFVKVRLALQRIVGKDYRDFSSILDWGCGCGRFSRYFESEPNATLTGVDVDAGSAAWCAEHLRFGAFSAVPLRPPTPLVSGSFDLLVGISIFTHLGEEDHLAWLDELARIVRPGGIVAVTVHGDATLCRLDPPFALVDTYLNRGFVDMGTNPDLLGTAVPAEYYRNVLISHRYIRRHWSRHFTILEIVNGYIGNVQDLVVMRRR
jgi:SAM-dependent methyltransferase